MKWLRSLNFIRHLSAHHVRLWNANIVDRSPLPHEPYWQELNNARPFFCFGLMQLFLQGICPTSTWGQRLSALVENDFPAVDCGAINIDDFGLIVDWTTWDL